jgi:ParB family chromosome partitioning protein
MAKAAALGRGLSALLPSSDSAPDASSDKGEGRGRLYNFEERVRYLGRIAEVDVENVRPNPYQPRRDFSDAALDELAASIEQLGIIQPITVRAMDGGQFELISGERRLRAARRAGLKRVPAYVREADIEAMLEMAIVENVQREALNPIEIALGYQRLIEECGLKQEDVAQKVGKNRTTIANFLRLLKLPPRGQAMLRDGRLTVGHARALINIDDEKVQDELLGRVAEEQLSVREIEQIAREVKEAAQTEAAPPPPPSAPLPLRDSLQIQHFADRLRGRLSTQVKIKHKGPEGGKIEIAYYGDDDLERLLGLLGTRPEENKG